MSKRPDSDFDGLVTLERSGGVATITLNRPEVLNSLTHEMWVTLTEIIEEMANDEDTGAVILTGTGRAFSAGRDINEVQQRGDMTRDVMIEVVNGLTRLPQPTIAAINGYCFTGALELALACDILMAAESAKIGDTHAKFGMVPSLGGPQRLTARVGAAAAKELLFSSRHYSAAECAAIGLVNHWSPDDALMDDARALALSMSGNSRHSIAEQKKMVDASTEHGLASGLQLIEMFPPQSAPDMAERLATFKKT